MNAASATRSAAALITAVFLTLGACDFHKLLPQSSLGTAHGPTTVSTYVTKADGSLLFARDPRGPQFSTASTSNVRVLAVDDSQKFQTIDGFGAALTGSSAHLLANLPDRGAALLAELFRSDTGIGLSYVRLSVGPSDFSIGNYTYDDMAPGLSDPTLASFSIAPDAEVLSVLQTIHATSSDVRFMASPWTAPAWMKKTHTLFGGELGSAAYGSYARYLVLYVRALQNRGIALDALTPQNEPQFEAAYPTMTMSAADEALFLKTALGPAFKAAFPATKLLVYDGNWDQPAYPLAVLGDRDASQYVAGSSFHCYGGNVSQMSDVHRAYPQKAIYISECGGGSWAPKFGDNLAWDMQNLIIGGTANWARTVLLWNLALDDTGGPTNRGCTNCRGVVTIHADGSVTRNIEYYVLAHVAKFVRPGAIRIASSSPLGTALPNVAFVNTDGSTVLIAFNASARSTSFAVRYKTGSFRYTIPGGAVVTFHWT